MMASKEKTQKSKKEERALKAKIKEAEDQFKMALKNDPFNAYLILMLGDMYQNDGDIASAQKVYHKAFKLFKQELEYKKEDLDFIKNFMQIVLKTSFPPEEVVPLLDKIANSQKDPNISNQVKATAGVLFARGGQYENARLYYDECSSSFIDLIAEDYNTSWGSIWKYLSESISHAPKMDPFSNSFSNRLLEKAQEIDRKDLEYMAHLLRALSYSKSARVEDMIEEYNDLGSPLEIKWSVIGPFRFQDFSGFLHEFTPEKNTDITALHQEGKEELYWQSAQDTIYDGYMNLKSIYHPSSWAVAYGQIYIYSPDDRKVQIRFGNDEACKIWLNNKLIWQHFIRKGARIDRDMMTVVLHPGMNKLLIKVTNTDLEWGYYFRVTDHEGNGIPDIEFHSPEEVNKSLASL